MFSRAFRPAVKAVQKRTMSTQSRAPVVVDSHTVFVPRSAGSSQVSSDSSASGNTTQIVLWTMAGIGGYWAYGEIMRQKRVQTAEAFMYFKDLDRRDKQLEAFGKTDVQPHRPLFALKPKLNSTRYVLNHH